MEKTIRQEMKVTWVLKALMAAYVVTGLLLLLLTLLVYKMEFSEEKVTAGITAIYVLSTFVGGFVIGKLSKMRKFLWGLAVGILYFGLFDFLWDLSYLTRKWDEYFDVVPALCGRWNGGWNDFLKESLLNLTCM